MDFVWSSHPCKNIHRLTSLARRLGKGERKKKVVFCCPLLIATRSVLFCGCCISRSTVLVLGLVEGGTAWKKSAIANGQGARRCYVKLPFSRTRLFRPYISWYIQHVNSVWGGYLFLFLHSSSSFFKCMERKLLLSSVTFDERRRRKSEAEKEKKKESFEFF